MIDDSTIKCQFNGFFLTNSLSSRYRCSGTLVACQFAASGCDYRGPTKSMSKHQTECRFKKEGKNFLKTFFFLAVEVPEVVYYHTMWPCEESKAFGKWKSLINSEVKASRVKDEIDLEELSLTWLFPPSDSAFQSAKKNLLKAVLLLWTKKNVREVLKNFSFISSRVEQWRIIRLLT